MNPRDTVQMAPLLPWRTMDCDQLLSAMTLCDREHDYDGFRLYREEIMYRLRCAEPLINWTHPSRMEKHV